MSCLCPPTDRRPREWCFSSEMSDPRSTSPEVLLLCRVHQSKGRKSRKSWPTRLSLLDYHTSALVWSVPSALYVLPSQREGTMIWGREASLRKTLLKAEGSNRNIQSLGDDTYLDKDNILEEKRKKNETQGSPYIYLSEGSHEKKPAWDIRNWSFQTCCFHLITLIC